MIKRIELKNFMSHTATVIEPAAGLTVIVGPNNCGKSAIVSALQILCHNDSSTHVLRHGERECSIKVETDDGHVVEWLRRKNGSPRYVVDGKDFDRLGRGPVPDELLAALRLQLVGTEGNTSFDVHFGEQKAPIFLLDKPSSNAALFFASSSDASKLVQMQNLHRQKVAEARHRKTDQDVEADRLAFDLKALAPIGGIDKRVGAAEKTYVSLVAIVEDLRRLAETETALEIALANAEHCVAESAALNPLTPPPLLDDTAALYKAIQVLAATQDSLSYLESQGAALGALTDPPNLEEPGPLDSLITKIDVAATTQHKAEASIGVAEGIKDPPVMNDVAAIRSLTDRMVKSQQVLEGLEATDDALSVLCAPPSQDDEATLDRIVDSFRTNQDALLASTGLLSALEDIAQVPILDDIAGPKRLVGELSEVRQRVDHWASIHDVLDRVSPCPQEVAVGACEESVEEMVALLQLITATTIELEEIDSDLEAATSQIREWAIENRICPTCGSEVEPDELIAITKANVSGIGHAHG